MSPGIPPAAVEESADKVTVVLAVGEGLRGTLQTDSVGVGRVPRAAVVAEIVPAAAVRREPESPVWSLGRSEVQGEPGRLAAAGVDSKYPAAGHRATGQTVKQRFGNKGVEIVWALVVDLTEAPVTVGAYVVADMVVLLECEGRMLEGVAALGKMPGLLVVQVEAENRGFVVSEDLGQVGHSKVSGFESHSPLVPVVHRIPSVHTTCFPCLQEYVLASLMDIAVVLEGRTPAQDNQTVGGL